MFMPHRFESWTGMLLHYDSIASAGVVGSNSDVRFYHRRSGILEAEPKILH